MARLCLGECACPHCENHSLPYEVEWSDDEIKTIQCETCKSIFEISFKPVEIHEPDYKRIQDIGG